MSSFTKVDIHNFVNDTLDAIERGSIEEAINWADLKCKDVIITWGSTTEVYIWIDECSPDCVELPRLVSEAVDKEFNVVSYVNCEW